MVIKPQYNSATGLMLDFGEWPKLLVVCWLSDTGRALGTEAVYPWAQWDDLLPTDAVSMTSKAILDIARWRSDHPLTAR